MTVDDVARQQFGIITRVQARSEGLSSRQIDHRLKQGTWQRVHPSVYRHAVARASWEGRLLAAVLASDGIASHRSAAALWWLELYTTPRPEITVPRGRRARLVNIREHQSTQWDRRDEILRRGIPCTGIERTILDCGAVVSARTVERLAEAAIRREYTSWLELLRCLRRHSRRGRSGCLNLRRVLELRLIDQTIALSDFGRLIASLLVDAGLPKPLVEYRIHDDAGEFILQADLAWPDRKKAWELDGLQFHFGRTDVERDRRKRNRAKSYGWNIQEILWSMYTDDPDGLVTMARRFLLRSQN